MSGGASGVGGYIYQEDYLAYRILASVVAKAIGDNALRVIESFQIEGRMSEAGPSWDLILKNTGNEVELLECKDTAITKQDREIFYKRVRAEVHSGTNSATMRIGWVTDPEKQGDIITHLCGMASLINAGGHTVPNSEPTTNVGSAQTALNEALFYLSHPNPFEKNERKTQPIALAESERILRTLSVDRWTGKSLKESVLSLVESVFKSGTANALLQYITGHLTREIRDNKRAADTLDGFLDKVGTISVMVSVEGSFKTFLQRYSAAAPNSQRPGSIIWDQLPGRPSKEWSIAERLPSYSTRRSHVIIAQQGVGKTVLSQQAYLESGAENEKHRVLRVDAALLEDELRTGLLSFCTVLSGLGRTWFAVDGLDAIERSDHQSWQTTLNRLFAIPNLSRCRMNDFGESCRN